MSGVPETQEESQLDRDWDRLQAQLAVGLWTAVAESGIPVNAIAGAANLPERKVRRMLAGDFRSVSTEDIFRAFYAMGFRVVPQLQEATPDV